MPMKLLSKNSHLQQKLTFYPLLWFAIGLLITFTATVAVIKAYLDNYLINQIIAFNQQIAKDINNLIDGDLETISVFLLSDTMRDMNDPARQAIALERLLSRNKNFLEAHVIDLQGQTLISVSCLRVFSNLQKPDFRKRAFFQEAMQNRVGVSGWENLMEKDHPYWYLAAPIEKYQGKMTGVLVVAVDLRPIEDVILTSEAAKYGQPTLIDRDANILVDPDKSKMGLNIRNCPIAQRVIRGEIGAINTVDQNGQKVFAAYKPIYPYGWGLMIQVPPGQTIYVIRDKVILLFTVMMILIFIVTGLFIYLSAGKVVNPIKELTRASQKLGRGEALDYVPVEGNDEIAQLSLSFHQMASSLQDMEKERAQYLSMIAHDLRNPLASITTMLQESQAHNEQVSDTAPQVRTLAKLEQVNRLINDLLEFSRLYLGEISLKPEVVSVRYLCENLIAGYRAQSSKFILRPFEERICVWADPVRLEQIFQNIFDNSLKYTTADTPVIIDCEERAAEVEISIADQGPGIPPEVLKKLFQPFQANPLQKKGSYGLGLTIAKKLALKMNGDLKVQSVQNQGTIFRIILPKKGG
ncbi:MAG: sensor histidine kinase [Firmicutes bacterium]|nr:sensor histidine kinase [Bacillota bacterium]